MSIVNPSLADELKIAVGVAGTGFSFMGLSASELAGICTAIFMLISAAEKILKIYRMKNKDGTQAEGGD